MRSSRYLFLELLLVVFCIALVALFLRRLVVLIVIRPAVVRVLTTMVGLLWLLSLMVLLLVRVSAIVSTRPKTSLSHACLIKNYKLNNKSKI